MPAPLDLLARHLSDQARLGHRRLNLTESSRQYLRSFARKPKAIKPQANQPESAAAPLQVPPKATPKSTATPPSDTPAPRPTALPPDPVPAAPDLASASDLAALRELVEQSPSLSQIPTLRDRLVFSVGSAEAPIVFIGEAPGQLEERQAEPLVGPAGKLLDKIISAMRLNRGQIYITNLVKYRPRIEDLHEQGSRNRKPTAAEMATFRPVVLRELELIRPRCVVVLGGSAHRSLLQEDLPVSRARGQARQLPGLNLPVITTYHPAYLLRLEGRADELAAKRQVWEDLLRALELAELPITEKMRSYFKK